MEEIKEEVKEDNASKKIKANKKIMKQFDIKPK
jgi:hypothetical protein